MTPDHIASQLVDRLAREGSLASDAFDELTGLGEVALPVVVAALASRRSWPLWVAVLSRLEVKSPADLLAPLTRHADHFVASAAVHALGRCGDPLALHVLDDVLASHRHLLAGVAAVGNLGAAAGVAIVRRTLIERAGDLAAPGMQLGAEAAQALARLGDHSLTPAAIELSRATTESAQIRALAVAALDVSVGDGVAAALHVACRDPDDEVAEAALVATLRLGRVTAVERWLALASAIPARAERVSWCIEQLVGEAPDPSQNMASWWSRRRDRFLDDTCYRLGQPASPAVLLDRVSGPDSRSVRDDLRHMAALTFLATELDQPSPRERTMIDRWWQQHADAYPPGQLHRWGRSYSPDVVGEP